MIHQMRFYSSAKAISNTTNYQNPEWNLRVYQFTDIAIYLNRLNPEGKENYVTNLVIQNIDTGSPKKKLYYLNPNMFGNGEIDEDNLIENDLDFIIVNSENKDNSEKYEFPVFFQDFSNPITLRLVNHLSDNYKMSNEKSLNYSGAIIRDLGFSLQEIKSTLKFDIKIDTKDKKERSKSLSLEIPLENSNTSIFDGDIEKKEIVDIEF